MIANFVRETASNPGTSTTFNLIGPVTGSRSFVTAFGSGAVVDYVIKDGTNWEIGIGSPTSGSPNTFTRTTVIQNSAGTTARINFTAIVEIFSNVIEQRVGWMLIQKQTFSAVTNVDFLLPTTFSLFRLEVQRLTVGTSGAVIGARFSSDGGSTFLSTTNYLAHSHVVTAGVASGAETGSQTAISLQTGLTNSAAYSMSGSYIVEPGTSAIGARLFGEAHGANTTPAWVMGKFGGVWGGTAAAMNALRLFSTSGNFTGTAQLLGLR
jgi:hypothetical protein